MRPQSAFRNRPAWLIVVRCIYDEEATEVWGTDDDDEP
jgi:hypothetical protein